MSDTIITTLPNGLRVVTRNMPGLHSATLGLWVSAGGRDERAEQNGIAHFLEHMAFKGTARRTALQIAEEIEDVGGYINAYTSRDTTAYYARVLAADTALALDVISDIVLNPAFDQRARSWTPVPPDQGWCARWPDRDRRPLAASRR